MCLLNQKKKINWKNIYGWIENEREREKAEFETERDIEKKSSIESEKAINRERDIEKAQATEREREIRAIVKVQYRVRKQETAVGKEREKEWAREK